MIHHRKDSTGRILLTNIEKLKTLETPLRLLNSPAILIVVILKLKLKLVINP